jgi:hypothetical protein
MWKGSLVAGALILITAVCVMGCSAEDCSSPEAHGSCHQHSQKPDHQKGHECFHKAVSPETTSTFAPFLNVALIPQALVATDPIDLPGGLIPGVVESPPAVDPALTLRI